VAAFAAQNKYKTINEVAALSATCISAAKAMINNDCDATKNNKITINVRRSHCILAPSQGGIQRWHMEMALNLVATQPKSKELLLSHPITITTQGL